MIGGDWEKNRLTPVTAEPGKPIELPEEGLTVTPLAANHTCPEQSLMYAFEAPGWKLLITGDTDMFPESSWKFLENFKLTAMTVDATWGMEDRRESHLGIPNIVEIAGRLRAVGAADGRTRIVPVHFAHGRGARLHDEFERLLKPLGMEPAWDGMRIPLAAGDGDGE